MGTGYYTQFKNPFLHLIILACACVDKLWGPFLSYTVGHELGIGSLYLLNHLNVPGSVLYKESHS